jgi:hypothetical protein
MNKVLSVLAITLILSAGNSPVQQIETTYELYSRNNVNSSWRTILQVSNQGFQCLIKLSFGCTTDPYIRGDLMP